MNHSQLIDELLQELSYRVGIVDIYNEEQQSIMSEILTEWGEFEAKETIFRFLNEDDEKRFKNPILNRKIKYVGKDGKEKEGLVGNLLTSPKDSPGRIEAEKQLPPEGSDARDAINQEIGSQGGGGPQDNAKGGGTDVVQQEKPQGTSLKQGGYGKIVDKEEETRKKLDGEDTETKNTSPSEEQKELAKADASKVLKQILMTQEEAAKSQEGVGLGTAESRTGESVTVYAGQKIQQLMSEGKSYDEARDEVEYELIELAKNKDYVLTKDWVKSGLAVFDYLNDTIGIDNIENFAWDTPEGNKLVKSEGHGTSADMFVRTTDGRTIGVSLKKDFKVFIVNGGYGKAMKQFEDKIGITLPKECQASHYTKRRNDEYTSGKETVKSNRKDFEEVAQRLLDDEEYFNKIFGPKAQSYEKRKRYIEKKLGISNYKDATPQQLVDILINENQKSTGDDLKFFASFNKEPNLKEKYGLYTNLRDLDNEMTDNIFEFFKNNESARIKYKEKIIEDTHILDTLFPNEPLNDFKTIFGTNPAVEMTREAVGSIFGVSELMKEYEETETLERKSAIRELIENQIKDKLLITKKKGVPVIAINLDGPPPSELPLYKLGVRTRGIGSAQTLEVSQETFGSLALKNGNTNVSEWDDKDRRTVVEQESKDILSLLEDEDFDISDLSSEQLGDLNDKIKLLENWFPKSPSLKKVKSLIENN
jgi:hypothetical protein